MIFTLEADIRGYLSSVDETHRTPNKNSLVCFPLELSPGRLIPHGVENETYFRLYGTKYSSLFNRKRWKSSWLFDCLVFYAQSAVKIVMKFNKHFKFTQKKNAFFLCGVRSKLMEHIFKRYVKSDVRKVLICLSVRPLGRAQKINKLIHTLWLFKTF